MYQHADSALLIGMEDMPEDLTDRMIDFVRAELDRVGLLATERDRRQHRHRRS